MRSLQQVDAPVRADFAVYLAADDSPVTGLVNGDFTKLLERDGVTSSVVVTVTEVGSGRYTATFTPDDVGVWTLIIRHATHAPRGWIETFDVTELHSYQAKVVLIDDDAGGGDRYEVVFFKDGQPMLAGITVPSLTVRAEDGSVLISAEALTQIGATGLYFHMEGVDRIVSGTGYHATTTWTADGVSHTWAQPVGRDGSV